MASEGLTHLFPVQEQVIPFIIKEHQQPQPFRPHDICVSAPTGSGKTLSFVLPIVQVSKIFFTFISLFLIFLF